MEQLLAHAFGDYVLQSTWMALRKSKVSWVCALHCFTYTLCFLPLTRSWAALAFIFATHFLIDRFDLARYLVWVKEGQRPGGLFPWRWCALTGYFDEEKVKEDVQRLQKIGQDEVNYVVRATDLFNDPNVNRPIWIRVWLTIFADNALHLLCNYVALAVL